MNYLLSDMITRMRNAGAMKKEYVECVYNNLCYSVCSILKDQGYIESFEKIELRKSIYAIKIKLKYKAGGHVIKEFFVVSKPSRRVYAALKEIVHNIFKNKLGITILSTPKGILANEQAIDLKVGGEVLCRVF